MLKSKDLMEGRRRVVGKSFHVPVPGVEASYILAKAAAKRKEFSDVSPRLRELLDEDSPGVRETLHRLLGCPSLPDGSIANTLLELETWFLQSPIFRRVRSSRRLGSGELSLYLRRSIHPTGIWLAIEGHPDSRATEQIIAPLLPLFRRTHYTNHVSAHGIPGILAHVIRTSLVIESQARRLPVPTQWRLPISGNLIERGHETTRRLIEQLATRVDHRLSIR
jgi:hypothetical protein